MPQDIDSLLHSYPRQRPPLTKEHEACFVKEYRRNREGRVGINKYAMRLEGWMHRSIGSSGHGSHILDLGAGNLNHVPYEPDAVVYDVVEPFHDLLESSSYKDRVRKVFNDIEEVPGDYAYDRIVAVAVLEHLTNLPAIVARSALLLNENGRFQAGIPSDGFLWGLAWRTTTGIAYRLRTKLDYSTVMRHEHINTADEITAVLRYFFRRVGIRRFPMPWKHMSFYTVLDATEPRIEVCRAFAEKTRGGLA